MLALVRDANPGARPLVDTATARAHLLQTLGQLTGADRPALQPIAHPNSTSSSVLVGQPVSLSGQLSEDPFGNALTYRWTMTDKPGTSQATLTGADSAQPAFTPDMPGPYTLTLVVNNGHLDSAPANITIVAASPPPPATLTGLSITAAPAKIAIGGSQQLVATASYSDASTADVSSLAAWSSNAPGVIGIDAQTGIATGITAGTAQISASLSGMNASAVTIEAVELAAPVLHQPVSGTGSVTIQWDPVANAGSYALYWLEDAHGVDTSANRIADVQSGHVHSGRTGGRTYAYRVAAVLGSTERLSTEAFAYVYGAGEPSGQFANPIPVPSVSNGAYPILLPDGEVLLVGQQIRPDVPAERFD
ncbi:MAG: PKD domain-containing protein, partial [Burkholderiaceae bacterium]